YATAQLAARTTGYPLEEINEYVRTHPAKAAQVWRTLSYFDPLHFAPKVQADTVLVTGNEQDFYAPDVMAPLVEALGARVAPYETAHSSYKDGICFEAWLRERYGFTGA